MSAEVLPSGGEERRDPEGAEQPAARHGDASLRSWRDGLAAAPVVVLAILMILWAAHDGGYDEDTWYWGALVMLALTLIPAPFGQQGIQKILSDYRAERQQQQQPAK